MPKLTSEKRKSYALAITEMAEERTEYEGEEHGDYADARRYYIEDASDEEILDDFRQETDWKLKRDASPKPYVEEAKESPEVPEYQPSWPFPTK